MVIVLCFDDGHVCYLVLYYYSQKSLLILIVVVCLYKHSGLGMNVLGSEIPGVISKKFEW